MSDKLKSPPLPPPQPLPQKLKGIQPQHLQKRLEELQVPHQQDQMPEPPMEEELEEGVVQQEPDPPQSSQNVLGEEEEPLTNIQRKVPAMAIKRTSEFAKQIPESLARILNLLKIQTNAVEEYVAVSQEDQTLELSPQNMEKRVLAVHNQLTIQNEGRKLLRRVRSVKDRCHLMKQRVEDLSQDLTYWTELVHNQFQQMSNLENYPESYQKSVLQKFLDEDQRLENEIQDKFAKVDQEMECLSIQVHLLDTEVSRFLQYREQHVEFISNPTQ